MKNIRKIILGIILLQNSIVFASDYSLQFNGSNQYVDCGLSDSLKLSGEFTLEAWILASDIPDNVLWAILCSQNDGTISGTSMFLDGRLNSDSQTSPRRHVHFQLGNGSWHGSNSNAVVPLNQWVHLAVTRKPNEDAKIYYNGTLVPLTSNPWTGGINFTSNWNIARQQDLGRYFKGAIDEVRIWKAVLTPQEIIDTMFSSLAGTEPNLVACWNFDEGAGSNAADLTSNANTGTLYNSPTWLLCDKRSAARIDAMIKNETRAEYLGSDIFNDIPNQTSPQTAPVNIPTMYDLKFQNDGIAPDIISITANPTSTGWSVSYINLADNSDITASITSSGFESNVLTAGASVEIRLLVIPDSSLPDASVQDITLTASSTANPSNSDAVMASTTLDKNMRIPLPYNYTDDSDFDKGTLIGLEYQTVHNQLAVSQIPQTFPYIWVPNSNEGTVSKVDTRTGKELARFHTGPTSTGSPSRTTVDLYGNCWVANRVTGTVVKIALLENGIFIDRNGNAVPDTSQDLNGDGNITGSEILPWGQDECVIYEVVLVPSYEGVFAPGSYTGPYANDNFNPGPRGLAVDRANNLWVGTYGTKKFYYINSHLGKIEKTVDVSSANHTSYGAVMDANGILWSSGQDKNHILRLDPNDDSFGTINLGHFVYGLGLDNSGHLFVSGWTSSQLSKVDLNTSAVLWTKTAVYGTKGVAVTNDDDVWLAVAGSTTVTRWSNEGVLKATIQAGAEPTGVSVDNSGKVWVVNNGDEYIKRIDPNTNIIDLSKNIVGGTHYGYSDMTGIMSRNITTKIGTWQVIHDAKSSSTQWGMIKWNAYTPSDTNIKVQARSSSDCKTWSPWEDANNLVALSKTPDGRYLQIQATLQMFSGSASPILYDLAVGYLPPGDLNRDAFVNLQDLAVMANHWLESGLP